MRYTGISSSTTQIEVLEFLCIYSTFYYFNDRARVQLSLFNKVVISTLKNYIDFIDFISNKFI